MNFTCDSCQRRYTIADEKVRGKTVKVRCRHCGHLIPVTGPVEEVEERTAMMSPDLVEALREEQRAHGGAAAPPPLETKPEWFVMVRGKQTGPVDQRGIAELVRVGEANARSYFWRKGMAEWKRAEEISELSTVFAAPVAAVAPPPPVAPPVPQEPERDEPLASAASKGPALDELFSDANLPQQDEPLAVAASSPKKKKKKEEPEEDHDPFAALGEIDPSNLPPPGEATAFFIAQAGVNKRNPPWKIAAFVLGSVGAVAGLLFALSTTNIVPLTVKRVDATGQEVEQSVFSGQGISALGDMLMGKGKKEKAPVQQASAPSRPPSVAAAQPASGANRPKVVDPGGHEPTADELAALYGDSTKRDKGPRVRKDAEAKAQDTSSGGLNEQQVAKVVAQSQSAFQSCIEQELRKNPNLKVPRFYIKATVANSGVVKSATIDRREIDSSNLGECLKGRARRMVFAQFSGDDVQVEIPLIVGVSM